MDGTARPVLPSVLLINGLVDILLAFVLIGLPLLGVGLPGLADPDAAETFLASGWGLATLILGLSRLWAWRKAEYRTFMGIIALLEGLLLAALCIVSYLMATATLLQALLPTIVGLGFFIAYALCFTIWRKGRRVKEPKAEAAAPQMAAPQMAAPQMAAPQPITPPYTPAPSASGYTPLTPTAPANPAPPSQTPPSQTPPSQTPPSQTTGASGQGGGQPPLMPLN